MNPVGQLQRGHWRARRAAVILLLAASVLVTALGQAKPTHALTVTSSPRPDVVAVPSPPLDAEEAAFMQLLNAYRAQQNPPTPPVTVSDTLTYAARVWSLTMARYNVRTHEGATPGGTSTFVTRLLAANYPLTTGSAGESITSRPDGSAASALLDLQSNDGNDHNLLNLQFRAVGLARAQSSSGVWYWTLGLGGTVDTNAPPAAPPAPLTLLLPSTTTPTPVIPELPPLWLFGSGLLALGWFGRRTVRR